MRVSSGLAATVSPYPLSHFPVPIPFLSPCPSPSALLIRPSSFFPVLSPAGCRDRDSLRRRSSGGSRAGSHEFLTEMRSRVWSNFRSNFRWDFRSDFRSDFRWDFRSDFRSDFRLDFRSDFRSDFRTDFRSDFRLVG